MGTTTRTISPTAPLLGKLSACSARAGRIKGEGSGLCRPAYKVYRWYEYGTGRYSRTDPIEELLTARFIAAADELLTAAFTSPELVVQDVLQYPGVAGALEPFVYVGGNPVTAVDLLGLWKTLADVPPVTNPKLKKFLDCLEECVGKSFIVTSTTEGKHADPGHAAGTSADVRPMKVPSKKVFRCAEKCNAARCLDERTLKTKFRTGPHYHFQTEITPAQKNLRNDCVTCGEP